MVTKVWQAEAVKSHLLALRTGVRASVPSSLVQDNDGRLTVYFDGCEAALKYLAERFAVSLDDIQPYKKPQTGELRLKTWSREEIKLILEAVWDVMHDRDVLPVENNVHVIAYDHGIEKIISYLARSFGIKDWTGIKR